MYGEYYRIPGVCSCSRMVETLSRRIFRAFFFLANQLWGELLCKREPNNVRDSCTVTVIQDDHLVEVLQQYARIAILEASHVKKKTCSLPLVGVSNGIVSAIFHKLAPIRKIRGNCQTVN